MIPDIIINGKKVKSPVFRILIIFCAMLFSIFISAVTVSLVLHFVGVIFTPTFAIVITCLGAMGIGIVVVILFGWIIELLLKPFTGKKEE